VEYEATVIEAPKALVRRPRLVKLGNMNPGLRVGKGFSLGELEAVRLDAATARKLGLRVDVRRRSVRRENVEVLRRFLGQLGFEL